MGKLYTTVRPQSTAKLAGRPIHPMTVALPVTLLIVTFVCDVSFYVTRDPLLAIVSFYALGAGIVFAAIAGVFGFIDYFWQLPDSQPASRAQSHDRQRKRSPAFGNFLVPYGAAELKASIVLSTIVFAVIHLTGWMGSTMVYRHGVEANTAGEPNR